MMKNMKENHMLTVMSQGLIGSSVTVKTGECEPSAVLENGLVTFFIPDDDNAQNMLGHTLSLLSYVIFNPSVKSPDFLQFLSDDPLEELAASIVLSARSDILMDSLFSGCGFLMKNTVPTMNHPGVEFLSMMGKWWVDEGVLHNGAKFLGLEKAKEVWDIHKDILVSKKNIGDLVPVVQTVKELLEEWLDGEDIPQSSLISFSGANGAEQLNMQAIDATDIGEFSEMESELGSQSQKMEESDAYSILKDMQDAENRSAGRENDDLNPQWSKRPPTVYERNVADKLSNIFSQLVADVSPDWEYDEPQGKINLSMVMQPNYDLQECFINWNHDAQKECSVDIVVLADRSGSMSKDIDEVMGMCWSVHHSLAENMDSDMTIIAYNGGTPIEQQSLDNDVVTCKADGGTILSPALHRGIEILDNSEKAHKLMIILTDGHWFDKSEAERIIDIMNYPLGIVLWGGFSEKVSTQKYIHYGDRIEKVAQEMVEEVFL